MNKFGLTDEQYKRFTALHARHLKCWESEERQEQHALDNIEKVEYKPGQDIFHVFYKKTKHFQKEWYHYDTNRGVWY